MTGRERPYVGYVRVSFVGSRKGDRFHSPDEQAAMIRAWAATNNVDVEVLPAELNAKGSDTERPMLKRAVEGVESGQYAGLVAAYLSRFARSAKHTLEIYERVEAAGGRVVAIAENIDTSTPDGRMTRTIHAAIAQAELERHGDRFAELRARTVERGIWAKRQTPLGYVRDAETRRLTPSDDADLVRDLYARKAAGEAVTALAGAAKMTPSGVRQLLRNRVYLGELRSGEHVNLDAHPPLVTKAEWEAAQSGERRPRSGREPALLSGLVRCGSCGRVASRSSSRRAKGGEVYICHAASPCPHHASVNAQALHEHVEPIATALLSDLVTRERADAPNLHALEEAEEAARLEFEAFVSAVSAADIGASAFAAGARTRRRAWDEAREERQRAEPTAAVPADIVDLWPTMSARERNLVLRSLLEAVVVWPSSRTRHIPVADRTQVLLTGADIVHDFGATPERRRPAIPIARLDEADPRLAVPGGHDLRDGSSS